MPEKVLVGERQIVVAEVRRKTLEPAIDGFVVQGDQLCGGRDRVRNESVVDSDCVQMVR
jgi:hypothetical protein